MSNKVIQLTIDEHEYERAMREGLPCEGRVELALLPDGTHGLVLESTVDPFESSSRSSDTSSRLS